MMNTRQIIFKILLVKISVLILTGASIAYAGESPQAGANTCQVSTLIGYRAYLWAVEDAKNPDFKKLDYAVDYWADMAILKHDRRIAHEAARYMANRLKPTGMRLPNQNVVYEAAREFMVKECLDKQP